MAPLCLLLLSAVIGNNAYAFSIYSEVNVNDTINSPLDRLPINDTYIDPVKYPLINDYLEGYPVQYDILEMNMVELERLLVDTKRLKVTALETMVRHALNHRFNPYMCSTSTLMHLLDAGKNVQRIRTGDFWISCAVNGVMFSGTRYLEFDIATKNYHIMIGVTEYNGGNIKSGPYPGYTDVPGISYYGANGKLYRHGSHQSHGPAFQYGDRFGVLVEICEDLAFATITFYIDGVKLGNAMDLKDYMMIDGGIVVVVGLYNVGDEVRIIQNAVQPRV